MVHGVEGLALLGVRGAQKMHITQWRSRLIVAVIESSSVSLHAVEPGTHKVGARARRGRHLYLPQTLCNKKTVMHYISSPVLFPWHRLQVHQTEGPRGRHDCEFALVAGDRLLLACVTAGEPEQFEDVFGNETNTMGEVTVYEIKENETTPGRGPLSFEFVHDIDVDGPRYVEIWCVYHTLDSCGQWLLK